MYKQGNNSPSLVKIKKNSPGLHGCHNGSVLLPVPPCFISSHVAAVPHKRGSVASLLHSHRELTFHKSQDFFNYVVRSLFLNTKRFLFYLLLLLFILISSVIMYGLFCAPVLYLCRTFLHHYFHQACLIKRITLHFIFQNMLSVLNTCLDILSFQGVVLNSKGGREFFTQCCFWKPTNYFSC